MAKLWVLFFLFVSFSVTSSTDKNFCFPQSEIRYSASDKSITPGLPKEKALVILKDFESKMTPYLRKHFQKKMVTKIDWSNDKVNAYATRDDDNNPVIVFSGGFMRHPLTRKEGLLFIACHELGHFAGGAPKKLRGRGPRLSWSSAEGQADYFASSKCLKIVLKRDKTIGFPHQLKFPEYCKDDLCKKVLLAGHNAMEIFASLKDWWEVPSFFTADPYVTYEMVYSHANLQCRLDTIIAGNNCKKDPEGKLDEKDPKVGSCVRREEQKGLVGGARPLCWYYPKFGL